MALLYAREITSGGTISETGDVHFQTAILSPQPDWITISGDQIQLEEPGAPWSVRIVHDFFVEIVSASTFTAEAHVWADATEFVTVAGTFGAGTHMVHFQTDDIYDGSGGSSLQPVVVEVHTGGVASSRDVQVGGHVSIHSVENPAAASAIWTVGILGWGLTNKCFVASGEDELIPGGDIGGIPLGFLTAVSPQPWATPGDPIIIVPAPNDFDNTVANFRIRVQGVISCFGPCVIRVTIDGGPGFQESAELGPATDFPFDVVFDLNTTLSVGDSYTYDVDLLDLDAAGGFISDLTIEFCYTTIPS